MVRKMVSRMITLLLLVTTALSILFLSGCGTKTIDLEKLLTISYSGVNGYGTIAGREFPQEALKLFDPAVRLFVETQIKILPDKTQALSNGDEVHFTVSYPETAANKIEETYHCKVKQEIGAVITKKVEGLKEAEPFDPFSGVEMSCTGYDGYGTVTFSGGELEKLAMLSFNEGKQGSFSNGDQIEVSYAIFGATSLEKFCLANLEKRPTRDRATFTVSGLKEPEKMDLFRNLSVSLDGADGYAKATVEGPYEDLTYRLDRDENISNGDILHVTAECWYGDVSDWCMDNYKAVPEKLTYDYEVSGLPVYITKCSDIPESLLNQMRMKVERTEDTLTQNAGFYDGVRFDSVKYVGNYFLVSKNTSGEIINRIILLYAVEVSAEGEPSKSYYHAVAFNNLMRYDASSGYVDLNDFETYGDDLELFSLVSLCGYRIYTDFVGNCIDSQRTNFNVETTIEEGNLPF